MSTQKLVKFEQPLPEKATTWQELISNIGSRISNILKSNPNAIVPMPIKDRNRKIVGWRYEITREVALSIMNYIENVIIALGGNVEYSKDITKDEGEFYVKASLSMEIPNANSPSGYSRITKSALGGSTLRELIEDRKAKTRMEHDALGTAETRALKRLIEEVIGEDRINKIIHQVKNAYGTERKKPSNINADDVLKSLQVFNDLRKQKEKEPVEINQILQYLKDQKKLNSVQDISKYSKAELVLINDTIIAWTSKLSKS